MNDEVSVVIINKLDEFVIQCNKTHPALALSVRRGRDLEVRLI